MYLFRM
jgi:hypothetical protein